MLSRIEKRVRKDIRLNNRFRKNEKVLVVDNKTKEAFLNLYLLKRITKGLDLKIRFCKNYKANNGFDKIILPFDADDVIEEFMKILTNGAAPKENKKVISLLRTVLDKEVAECTKRLGYQSNCSESSLDIVEARYPGSKFGFLKSAGFLKGLE